MHAGLRPQICAQIFQREYVPAQEHNYVVPRGAGPAHNAQRRLYVWAHAPFGARISAGLCTWLSRLSAANVPYFEAAPIQTQYKMAPKLKKIAIFVHKLPACIVPWFRPKSLNS